MLRSFINDECGFLISAELILIMTLMFCGVAVGWAVVRDSVVQELGDVAEAIGSVNQSYNYRGIEAPSSGTCGFHAKCSGSGFNDQKDDCDCDPIEFVHVNGKDDPNNSAGPGQAPEGR
jgi:hypothetical protein